MKTVRAASPKALCGVRDVRDYRIHYGGDIITGGSAFNIKVKSLRLGDFSQEDIRRLYEQHTAETGQRFDESIYPLVWGLTQGQPWLVNALAYSACSELQRDRSKPITPDLIVQAKEGLIIDRVTHLDQLTDKLKEPRVRRVIEPIVMSDDVSQADLADDDQQYVLDLGLIRRGPAGLEISNGIYKDFEPTQRTVWYILPDGTLDMPKMFDAFQQFFRENSEIWLERYEYREAGPQLILQAFLQCIINGGGRIDLEYGLGRKRTDILITWDYPGGVQRVVIDLKLVRGTLDKTIAEGLRQIAEYKDRTGTDDAHLIVFNRNPEVSWDDRILRRQGTTNDARPVTVWGL